ncbi:RhuM family protein [Collimonas antrihumi]|uniref:RhuM family protein n=1 Tax=Collimonas antrihumi TaxID=1940615 RepID=UPI001B8CDB11|nr:RhuM family protein [Collimonas antrihumi]
MSEPMEDAQSNRGELVLYATEDGQAQFYLHAEGGTVWLTQAELATLFQTTTQNITQHVKAIYLEGQLAEEATCKYYLQVQPEGQRQVKRTVKSYNLDLILAVGYRVRSPRGTQFRQWATTHLKEYLVKGFVIDDARLKEPDGWDYFDELLQRIRDIRVLNPQLVKAPRLCIDYVIFHELCHLKEHNHSPQYYRLLQRVLPDWEQRKMELDRLAEMLLNR